tara:strand:+ start:1603 stop:2286 length:684 start_codon:yes stop_codon:yes gene_type:complete
MRIIAFDLDETLGEFIYLSQLWNLVNNQISNLNQIHFNYLCELFPEFFRPHIFEILTYLVQNKQFDDKIVIYTNNSGEKSWTMYIKNYIEHKIGQKIFDNVICAYKVNGRIVEANRTSYEKIYSDLINCVGASYGTSVCFVDDRIHEKMKHPRVDYIHVKPYHTKFNKRNAVQRIQYSKLPCRDIYQFMRSLSNGYQKSFREEDVDNYVTQQMFLHLTKYISTDDNF